MADDAKIYLNGIDAETGQYLVPPMEIAEIAALAKADLPDKTFSSWIANVWHKLSTPFLGLPVGVDPADVTQAGWGIVFLKDESDAVKQALEPLIAHRRQQIANDRLVKVLEYRPGEAWDAWLGRYGVAPGSVDPAKVPYYLLLVGDPQFMPFEWAHLLDVEYGVGRLHFATPQEYGTYAAQVVAYETSATVPNAKEAVFFGTRHAFDRATQLSADYLINPLADGIPAVGSEPAVSGVAQQWGYPMRKLAGPAATKSALTELVSQQKPPALLFTASHGMGFAKGSAGQRAGQGALLCQDWPGFGEISPDHYFSAADVPADANVGGMVMFHFACYGAGTPQFDPFVHQQGRRPPQVAEKPFLAALPNQWLTHPRGGALAVIGHVERAWGYSIASPMAGPQIQTFQNAIGRILIGQPLGYALKDFNERYAALSTGLSAKLQQAGWGGTIDENALAANWIERNDAEGYLLIGDPAVKIRTKDLALLPPVP